MGNAGRKRVRYVSKSLGGDFPLCFLSQSDLRGMETQVLDVDLCIKFFRFSSKAGG
jgi:hypothetical protein